MSNLRVGVLVGKSVVITHKGEELTLRVLGFNAYNQIELDFDAPLSFSIVREERLSKEGEK